MSTEPPDIVEERAQDLLEHSISGVQAELRYAEGWLHESDARVSMPMWNVDIVAGAVGALASAWGRLVLWSRAVDRYEELESELGHAMEALIEVRRGIANAAPTDEVATAREVLQRLRGVYERLHGANS